MNAKDAFKFVATEVVPIYHAEGIGMIDSAVSGIAELATKADKTLRFCWNGTLATVNPGMSADDVYRAWVQAREEYQRNSPSYHSALCTVCEDKRFKLAR